jgi:hypothetical protein
LIGIVSRQPRTAPSAIKSISIGSVGSYTAPIGVERLSRYLRSLRQPQHRLLCLCPQYLPPTYPPAIQRSHPPAVRLCSPAMLPRLRGCHGFCIEAIPTQETKTHASLLPLRGRRTSSYRAFTYATSVTLAAARRSAIATLCSVPPRPHLVQPPPPSAQGCFTCSHPQYNTRHFQGSINNILKYF